MSTVEQRKYIGILRSELGICENCYRDILKSGFNAHSSKDISDSQADVLISALRVMKYEQKDYSLPSSLLKQQFSEFDGREGFASGAQLRKIDALWSNVSNLKNSKARRFALNKLLKKIVNVNNLRFLKSSDVKSVINALESMKKTKRRKSNV